MTKSGVVYILANRKHGALYVGVTSDLSKRIYQHRTEATAGFSAEYDIKRLVWFESHGEITAAIQREMQLKKWNRAWKIELIKAMNADWDDLAVSLLNFPPLSHHSRESGNRSPAASGDGFPLSRE